MSWIVKGLFYFLFFVYRMSVVRFIFLGKKLDNFFLGKFVSIKEKFVDIDFCGFFSERVVCLFDYCLVRFIC